MTLDRRHHRLARWPERFVAYFLNGAGACSYASTDVTRQGRQRYRVSLWCGRTKRLIEIASGTAIWYRGGVPPVAIRILVRDPTGELEPQPFLATDLNARPSDILAWFVTRWQVEYHAGSARRVLKSSLCGHTIFPNPKAQAENGRMVSKGDPDFQRRHCGRAPRNLAPSDFFHVPAKPRQYRKTRTYLEQNGKSPSLMPPEYAKAKLSRRRAPAVRSSTTPRHCANPASA